MTPSNLSLIQLFEEEADRLRLEDWSIASMTYQYEPRSSRTCSERAVRSNCTVQEVRFAVQNVDFCGPNLCCPNSKMYRSHKVDQRYAKKVVNLHKLSNRKLAQLMST